MKYLLTASAIVSLLCLAPRTGSAQFGSIGNIIENTVEKKVDEKVEQKTDEAMDSMLQNKKANNNASSKASSNSGSASASASANSASGTAASFAAYNNYDFKPGENIIFEDHFADDQDGEFPAHWDLKAGQGVVNRVQGEPAFLLTEGNYVIVTPRMTNESYLTDPFTVEFDYFAARGAYAPLIRFYDATNDDHDLHYGTEITSGDLTGNRMDEDSYYGRWHHAAIIYKGGQLKAYLDNTRGLVVPRTGYVPVRLGVGGIGDVTNPISIRNFRVANGGSSNTIGAMLTDGKFVTHGITFDVGKATLKPESMGVLNDVAKFMKENSATKFEIDGHTDADGPAEKNMTLSQQRADAVKAQLVTMGVDGSRLSTKGFGATKPIAGNDTPEGKANNRRVEFVKQ